ncbi:MAG: type II secretion system minor pseudopilin GspJ, partial [Betaproteobacteria bacterium]
AVSVNDGYYVVEITRQGWNNPLQRPRSELQRVGYLVSGDRLERHVWFVLDRAEDSEPVIQPLMEGIETFMAYLVMPDGDRKASISGDDLDELPIAIELTFSSEFWGDVTRFYDLPVFINEVVGAGDGETLDGSEDEGVQEDSGGEEGPPSPRPVTPQRPLNTSGDQL